MKKLSLNLALFASTILATQNIANANESNVILDEVTVIGSVEKQQLSQGSSYFIPKEALAKQVTTNIGKVLNEIPGVNITGEDGNGLRPNIGFRGGRVDRSADITLMEDNVLIAPAPYSAASAYYFPKLTRIESVEVQKGAAQVKYGPRTTNGVLNLVTLQIPNENGGEAKIYAGNNGQFGTSLNYGGQEGNWGYLLTGSHTQSSGFKDLDSVGGNTGYDLQDVMGKLRYSTDPENKYYQEVELKLGYTNELSNETYLGLTDEDYKKDKNRRYAASQEDEMDSEQFTSALTHYIDFNGAAELTTTAYYNRFFRNWYKLDQIEGTSIGKILADPTTYASEYAILDGADSAAGDLRVKANNRDYYSTGIQSRLNKELKHDNVNHNLELGVRYHYDEEDRFQWRDFYTQTNGSLNIDSRGVQGTDSNRVTSANAFAIYLQDEIKFGNWALTPGLRFEHIKLERDEYGTADPSRSGTNLQKFKNTVNVFAPGIGASYAFNNGLTAFGGIHKGFAPPKPPSNSASGFTDEEESINYELGARYNGGNLGGEIVGFFNDYSNLLGDDTFSSGGGSGDSFNGGEVNVYGVEASVNYDAAKHFNTSSLKIPLALRYTYTKAEFQNTFNSSFSEWGNVTKGDELPYIAPHQIYVSAGVGSKDDKWNLNLAAKYTDKMRTLAGSGAIIDNLSTDSSFIVDASADYKINERFGLFGAAYNILDDDAIASRRPAGVRPHGAPSFKIGAKIKL